jgi:hypothetical protein
MKKISDYAMDVYSQFGEDGIIQQIFNVIGTRSKKCIEFGAWDGFYLSNTANLWTNGWEGILLEGNSDKYQELLENVKKYPCISINAWVGCEGSSTLDAILTSKNLISDVDFLSIDIDGDDYYIFESLVLLKPRVISCEYNPTIPPWIELTSPKGDNYFGCSAQSLVKLAEQKGYKLIAMTETNCFFVVTEEFDRFRDYDTSFEKLYITKYLTYLITSYDGKYVFSQKPVYGFTTPCKLELLGDVFFMEVENTMQNYEAPPIPTTKQLIYALWKKFTKFLRSNIGWS